MTLHLAHGIHLEHLPTPGTAKMGFVGCLHTDAPDAISDFVSLVGEGLVFLLRDGLGIAQGMSRQGAVRVEAQDVHIHLGPLQPLRLLTETQNLFRLQIGSQIDAITVPCLSAAAALIQNGRIKTQQAGQTIAQVGPAGIVHQARLDIKGVGQFAGGQHPPFAIQQPSSCR